MTSTITQDNRKRPWQFDVTKGADHLVDMTYGYDLASNTTSITDTKWLSYTFDYDNLDRLTVVNGSVVLGYDTNGNITSKNLGGKNLGYNYNPSTGKLDTVTDSGAALYSFGYDAYGNIISNGIDNFVYDDASHLINVPSQGIDYAYDGNANRISTLTDIESYTKDGLLRMTKKKAGTETSEYIYLGTQLVARVDQCGLDDSDADGIPDCEKPGQRAIVSNIAHC